MLAEYVVFDLETTGLRPAMDRILEIGAVRVKNGGITDSYETLVDHGLPIPGEITRLTGITEEMTVGAPDIRTAVEGFLAFAGDDVLMGHNLPFDYSFMKQTVLNLGGRFERRGIDTLAIARKTLPQLKRKSLDSLASWYQIPEEHHHRALDDALTTARLYECLRREFGAAYPVLFEPVPLQYKARKDSPITSSQKGYLHDLIKYHRIETNVNIDLLTKSEASRMIDRILFEYGKPGASFSRTKFSG
ncbi:MAG: 3'-5' exonuclease [Clostridiales bacterium]|nr:3'-5' exonuclease [Clostridiales bacterium]